MPLFVPQDTDNFFPYSDTTQLIASANEMADANSTLSGKDRRSSFKLEKPKTEGITKGTAMSIEIQCTESSLINHTQKRERLWALNTGAQPGKRRRRRSQMLRKRAN